MPNPYEFEERIPRKAINMKKNLSYLSNRKAIT